MVTQIILDRNTPFPPQNAQVTAAFHSLNNGLKDEGSTIFVLASLNLRKAFNEV